MEKTSKRVRFLDIASWHELEMNDKVCNRKTKSDTNKYKQLPRITWQYQTTFNFLNRG